MSTLGEVLAELDGCAHEIAIVDEVLHHLQRIKKGEVRVPVTTHKMADTDYVLPLTELVQQHRGAIVARKDGLEGREVVDGNSED